METLGNLTLTLSRINFFNLSDSNATKQASMKYFIYFIFYGVSEATSVSVWCLRPGQDPGGPGHRPLLQQQTQPLIYCIELAQISRQSITPPPLQQQLIQLGCHRTRAAAHPGTCQKPVQECRGEQIPVTLSCANVCLGRATQVCLSHSLCYAVFH